MKGDDTLPRYNIHVLTADSYTREVHSCPTDEIAWKHGFLLAYAKLKSNQEKYVCIVPYDQQWKIDIYKEGVPEGFIFYEVERREE